MSRETMKLALEALEGIHPGNMTPMAEEYWNKAITALKTAQRTWVGLTDEEIDDIYQGVGKNDLMLVREVEAKLREKNATAQPASAGPSPERQCS